MHALAERRPPLSTPTADFDSPWKEALEEYLPDFLALCAPQIHAEIDWSQPPVFLDVELRKVVREAQQGTKRVDKLVKVWLRSGRPAWLLIHIEVQSQPVRAFAKRMFTYHARLLDRYNQEVVSLAVLADERPSWQPTTYRRDRWGCTLSFRYPVIKLTDWRERLAELEASTNPFAVVVLAHLATQATRGDAERRSQAKLGLIRRLYDRGYSRERILSLVRFIDWLLALPEDYERAVQQAIMEWEEERAMPYVTSFERLGRADGRLEGRAEGREEGLERGREEGQRALVRRAVTQRFGLIPPDLEARIAAAGREELLTLFDRVLGADQLDAI